MRSAFGSKPTLANADVPVNQMAKSPHVGMIRVFEKIVSQFRTKAEPIAASGCGVEDTSDASPVLRT